MAANPTDKAYSMAEVAIDRRRPGRQNADPALLPLLRETGDVQSLLTDKQNESDALSGARSIILNLIPSILIWITIGIFLFF